MNAKISMIVIAMLAVVAIAGCVGQQPAEQNGQSVQSAASLRLLNDTVEILSFDSEVKNVTNQRLREILGTDTVREYMIDADVIATVENIGESGNANVTVTIGYAPPGLDEEFTTNFKTLDEKMQAVYLNQSEMRAMTFNFNLSIMDIDGMVERYTGYENATMLDLLYYSISIDD